MYSANKILKFEIFCYDNTNLVKIKVIGSKGTLMTFK